MLSWTHCCASRRSGSLHQTGKLAPTCAESSRRALCASTMSSPSGTKSTKCHQAHAAVQWPQHPAWESTPTTTFPGTTPCSDPLAQLATPWLNMTQKSPTQDGVNQHYKIQTIARTDKIDSWNNYQHNSLQILFTKNIYTTVISAQVPTPIV